MPYGHTKLKYHVSKTVMPLRIKEILNERGITAENMSNDIGYNQGQVSRWLSGSRRANTEFLEAVAKYLDLSVNELFKPRQTPIIAYVGAGGEFYGHDDYEKGGGLEYIDAPAGSSANSVGVIVRGDSMVPVFFDGYILVYGEHRYDPENFYNKRCVCRLADGRTLIKTLIRGSQIGLFTLTSFNSGPIEDVALEWVARIECVLPR